jgi:hypothetical protein
MANMANMAMWPIFLEFWWRFSLAMLANMLRLRRSLANGAGSTAAG